jgi:hypothetical protein
MGKLLLKVVIKNAERRTRQPNPRLNLNQNQLLKLTLVIRSTARNLTHNQNQNRRKRNHIVRKRSKEMMPRPISFGLNFSEF